MFIPTIKASNVIYDFLTITSDVEFAKKKFEYENISSTNKLENFNNLQGILYCRYNPECDKQNGYIKEYIKTTDSLLSKLNNTYCAIQEEYKKISDLLNNLSDIYKQLKETSRDYDDPYPITQTYSVFENTYKDLGSNFGKQIGIIDREFIDFFDYFKQELVIFKDKVSIFEEYREEFFKAEKNLKSKKEKLFHVKNLQKWELAQEDLDKADGNILFNKELAMQLMCKNDSLNVEKRLKRLGVSSYSLLNEMHKLKIYYARAYHNHFSSLTERNSDFLSEVFSIVKTFSINNENLKFRRSTIK